VGAGRGGGDVSGHDPAATSRTLRSADALIRAGLAPEGARQTLDAVAARYAVAVTPAMAALIDPADMADPVARQFLPDPAELTRLHDELDDPIGDVPHGAVKGVVHRYPDRVLLKPTHACPVYCRFCFRREQVGPGGEALTPDELAAALDYVRARPAIREVILSGGDPLILSARRIRDIVRGVEAIGHVDILRIHTRVPLVDPARIDADMLAALESAKALFVVLHANHAREFAPAGRAACARLTAAGIPLLGQSVLLRGVNDDAATLEALMRAFLAARVKPYYLHRLDHAPGTARFRVPLADAHALLRELRGRVSGLAQPLFVLDIPGGHGKVPIGPSYLDDTGVRDPDGASHPFAERG
jgi:lysine 2,3-aminomutase